MLYRMKQTFFVACLLSFSACAAHFPGSEPSAVTFRKQSELVRWAQ